MGYVSARTHRKSGLVSAKRQRRIWDGLQRCFKCPRISILGKIRALFAAFGQSQISWSERARNSNVPSDFKTLPVGLWYSGDKVHLRTEIMIHVEHKFDMIVSHAASLCGDVSQEVTRGHIIVAVTTANLNLDSGSLRYRVRLLVFQPVPSCYTDTLTSVSSQTQGQTGISAVRRRHRDTGSNPG